MDQQQLQGLLELMTLDEKIGQMTQTTAEFFTASFDSELVETGPSVCLTETQKKAMYSVGSVLGVSSSEAINTVQMNYLEKSRLKIPLLFMHDAIHGYRTIFPIPLALAGSFSEDLVSACCSVVAKELRSSGIHVNFSPMADVCRDARWGRIMEGFGEDAIVCGRLSGAMIRGYEHCSKDEKVFACLKHFAAYGAPQGGKDYASVDMSLKTFFDIYARSYEIALRTKPQMVMSSFNSLNGQPVTGSSYLLKKVLRKKMNFEGLVISDWAAVQELIAIGVAENETQAASMALNAGVDIEMVSTTYINNARQLVQGNSALIEQINQTVMKILQLKNQLGLFENPYADEEKERRTLLRSEHLELATEAVRKTCVLLKNDQEILPISNCRCLLVLGPFTQTRELLGNWACKGKPQEVISLLGGLQECLKGVQINCFESLSQCPQEIFNQCDMILLALGEDGALSGEGHSSCHIGLAKSQIDLIEQVACTQKKFAAVIFSGRPLALGDVIDKLPAVLWCWYPGTMAGRGIAQLLCGQASPCAQLPVCFPREESALPVYYNELRSGRPASEGSYSCRYQDSEIGPLFYFGHGLIYGKIVFESCVINRQQIDAETAVNIQIALRNESRYTLCYPVLLFMEDVFSSVVRAKRELLDFRSVSFNPGERRTVSFDVTLEQLTIYDQCMQKVIDDGEVRFYLSVTEEAIGSVLVTGTNRQKTLESKALGGM